MKTNQNSIISSYFSFKVQSIFLVVIALLLYANTIGHDYVLDDAMTLTENKFVKKGINGIGDLLTKDSMIGFVGKEADLEGGRYRPLTLICFAIEYAFFGLNSKIGHFFNILFWCLLIYFLFSLLYKHILKSIPDLAFITTLLFLLHPIHTEVVANIKSRDEIFSLLFLILSLFLLFKNISLSKSKILFFIGSLFFYFLALMSKENGVTFILIIPLTLYVFTNLKRPEIIKTIIPYFAIFTLYFIIRISIGEVFSAESNELLNNPFYGASFEQKYSSIMVCLLKYLSLLVFPHPLSYDYTYNQIPLTSFTDITVILSICIHLFLVVFSLKNLKNKNIIAYGILFYLFSIFIASNIIVSIGAQMGERFLFQASLGFCFVFGVLLLKLASFMSNKNKKHQPLIISILLLLIIIPASAKTIFRNKDWKNEFTLYSKDVKASPNSAIANNYLCSAIINHTDKNKDIKNKDALLRLAVTHSEKSHNIYPKYYNAYVNKIIACIRLGELDEALNGINELKNINNVHPRINELLNYLASEYHIKGMKISKTGNLKLSVDYFIKATNTHPLNERYWYDLGGASFTMKNYKLAKKSWKRCLDINPKNKKALQGYGAVSQFIKE